MSSRPTIDKINIRMATADDIDDMAGLLGSYYRESATALADEMRFIAEEFTDFGDMAGGYLQWVATTDKDRVIGVCEATIRLFANGCETVHIMFLEGIAVDKSHAYAGVSAALLDAAIAWARAHDIAEIASDCEDDNADGNKWHKAMGFTATEQVVCYRKPI